jgi:hypothetical protein
MCWISAPPFGIPLYVLLCLIMFQVCTPHSIATWSFLMQYARRTNLISWPQCGCHAPPRPTLPCARLVPGSLYLHKAVILLAAGHSAPQVARLFQLKPRGM